MNILQGCPNLVCSLREDAEGKGKSVESPIKSFNENRLQINGSNFYVKFLSPPLKQEERSCNKGFVFNWAKTGLLVNKSRLIDSNANHFMNSHYITSGGFL